MKHLKKIGMVGWWGGRNIGDEYIKHCLAKAFEGDFKIKFIETPFDPNLWNLWNINRLDFLIIGGGGLFTKSPPCPFNVFNKWGHRLKIPFGFLGVGVQEISNKYKLVIEELVRRSVFFVVRDTDSFDLLNSFSFSSKIIKAPDLTFLYPYRSQRSRAKDKIGVNLRVWNFDKERTYDNYVWCQAINQLEGNKKTIPLSFKEKLEDRNALEGIHGIKNSDFSINLYRDINIMIGMRLHSLIFAVQNSIPVIGIAYAPKVRRFFYEIGFEEFCLEVDEYDRLKSVFYKALKRREELSNALSQYTLKEEHSIKKCIENIKNIIGTHS